MKKRLTVKDVLKTQEDVQEALNVYYDYKDKKISKEEFQNSLNEKFGADFTNEFWSRYLMLIETIKDINLDDSSVIERKKIQIERAKNNKYLTEISRREFFKEMIEEKLKYTEYTSVKKFNTYERFEGETNVYIADLHYENAGEFERVFNSIPKDVTNINLFFVGDETGGTLRVTDLLSGSSVVEQTCSLAKEVVSTVDNRVRKIVVLPGNHSELRVSNDVKGYDNPNLSFVFYSLLETLLPIECVYAEVYEDDKKIIQHGHSFSSRKTIEKFYEEDDRKIIFGHWHEFNYDGKNVNLPSCKIEQDDYSKRLGYKNKPQIVLEHNDSIRVVNIE